MVDRPIIFSAPMVQALLDGRKTQTRRMASSPLAQAAPGDRLWVRESLGRRVASFLGIEATNGVEEVFYTSDDSPVVDSHGFNLCPWWKTGGGVPSIHMPRHVSRLTLLVTEVRRQRLQEISEDDAAAEGWPAPEGRARSGVAEIRDAYPIGWFAGVWESIHGAGAWERDPPIVALTFTVHRCNIDAMEAVAHG